MKFLMVIVSEEYQKKIADIFAHYNCNATIIASTGDFLEYGEAIYLLGIEEEKADIVLKEIEREMNALSKEKSLISSSEEQKDHARVIAYHMGITQFMKIGGGEVKHDREKGKSTIF